MSPSSPDSAVARGRALAGELHADGRGWTLVTLAVGWFLINGMRFVIPALLPFITDDFPVSNATAGGAITLLWAVYALTQFPAGALTDRLGERRLLATSTLLAAGALAGYLGAATFAVFLLATAAFGFGIGLYGPARGTALTRAFPDYDGLAYGTVLAAGSLGAAILPPLAVVLSPAVGWRTAIGLSVPGYLLVGIAVWRTVPGGTATAVAADGGQATVRDVLRSVRDAVTDRGVVLGVVAITLMLFTFQGLTAFLTTYLVRVKGVSEPTAGLLFGVVFVVGALAQSVGGGLADRYGHSTVLAAVTFVGVVPLVALPLASGLLPLTAIAVVLGLRLAVGPVSNAYIVSLLPVAVRGTAWGLLRTAFFFLGAFGSLAVGAMADRALFAEAFFLLAALTAVAGVVYLFLPAREGVGA